MRVGIEVESACAQVGMGGHEVVRHRRHPIIGRVEMR